MSFTSSYLSSLRYVLAGATFAGVVSISAEYLNASLASAAVILPSLIRSHVLSVELSAHSSFAETRTINLASAAVMNSSPSTSPRGPSVAGRSAVVPSVGFSVEGTSGTNISVVGASVSGS